LRLFIPCAVETPLCAALLLTGHKFAVLPLVMVITLLTRLNYYLESEGGGRPGEAV